MDKYTLLIDKSEYQKRVLKCITSEEIDKYFNTTSFSDKPECKQAMIFGMCIASMLTSDCIITAIKVLKEECIEKEFTWSDKEDEDLHKNGVILIWVAGRTKAIQKFVEALSYRIGSKCDFSFAAGRAHIDIYKDAKERALEAINDEEFMNQFIVPYSQESYDNETYFEILH